MSTAPAITLTLHPIAIPLPQDTARLLAERLNPWQWQDPAGLLPASAQQANPMALAIALETNSIPLHWQTTSPHPAEPPQQSSCFHNRLPCPWPDDPTVLALIPHWGCEPWLRRCLASLQQQSHPPTQIVVIDDASAQPPQDIVAEFDRVTLLRSPQRVGPYALIQAAIDATHYDAYLFQDADDWSSGDRLETLLAEARRSGAALVGSQEIRLLEPQLQLQAIGYPLDVNRALAQAPGHGLLHPTSLVHRSLVQQLGGFATGLRFGGDSEFLLRAHWLARIVNSPRYCYFRRKRPDSLTTAADTGLGSPDRQALTAQLKQRARANAQRVALGQPPDLAPLKQVAKAVRLQHLWGPPLA